MNVEFHYYSTAFLAVKAGFPPDEAEVLAYAGQYVDHHHRAWTIETPRGPLTSRPTQNFSFWDRSTVLDVLAPFHFLPAGSGTSVRADGRTSPWDVRPNSEPAKALLVGALKTRNLHRIGLALHTFSDTWAHQNFTARDEEWNRLDPDSRWPAPGHAQAGTAPDLWLETWTDPRLSEPMVVNFDRFAQAARKVYRYLCTYRGKDFKEDEESVAEELAALIEAGRGRASVEDRAVEFILALDLRPYDRGQWAAEALEPYDEGEALPSFWAKVQRAGGEVLGRAGLAPPLNLRAKAGFEDRPLAAWLAAAEDHRKAAQALMAGVVGGSW